MDQLLVTLNLESFKSVLSSAIEEKLRELLPPPPEIYLTIDETAAFLRITRTTLHSYAKKGFVVPLRIGNKIRYSKSDVENSMK